MKIRTVILLAILCCPAGSMAENGVIPVERVRIVVPPLPPDWRDYPQASEPNPPPNPPPNPRPYYMPSPMPVWTPDVPVRPSRQGSLGIGLCYTGPLVKYFVTDKFAIELRDYITDDAYIVAPRLIGLFDIPKNDLYEFCYYGVEVGRVNFRGRVSRGGGSTAGCFVGVEKEIFQNIMLNVDAGPYWISIKDNQTGIRETGVDFVINSSVCWMFR